MTMANAPLSGRDEVALFLFLPNAEAKYFSKRDWTAQIRLNCFKKLQLTRSDISVPSSPGKSRSLLHSYGSVGPLRPLRPHLHVRHCIAATVSFWLNQ
jgi:hypothetical protein